MEQNVKIPKWGESFLNKSLMGLHIVFLKMKISKFRGRVLDIKKEVFLN